MKEKKLIFTFDSTKKSRFGVLPRYAKNESLIKWFELPNCFIFHNGVSWIPSSSYSSEIYVFHLTFVENMLSSCSLV